MFKIRNVKTGLVLAVVIGVLAGGVATAAIPDSTDGEIHGCRSNIGGRLRVIDKEAGEDCIIGETALSWNKSVSLSQDIQIVSGTVTIGAGGLDYKSVFCPSGYVGLSGGFDAHSSNQYQVYVLRSLPMRAYDPASGEGWHVLVQNASENSRDLTVYAVCTKLSLN